MERAVLIPLRLQGALSWIWSADNSEQTRSLGIGCRNSRQMSDHMRFPKSKFYVRLIANQTEWRGISQTPNIGKTQR